MRRMIVKILRRKAFKILHILLILAIVVLFLFNFSSKYGWERNVNRNVSRFIQPAEKNCLIQPRNICDRRLFVLIYVPTSRSNIERRQNIRRTWGNTSNFNYHKFEKIHENMNGTYLNPLELQLDAYIQYYKVKNLIFPVRLFFVVGIENNNLTKESTTDILIEKESLNYGDILQVKTIDNYDNLTLKMIMTNQWINENCFSNVKYVVKCDDDVFLNLPNLLHYLLGGTLPKYKNTIEFYGEDDYNPLKESNRFPAENTNEVLLGKISLFTHPIRLWWSKNYIPIYMYWKTTYPNFLLGYCYIMSMDTLRSLYKTSLKSGIILMEDVFMTGLCAAKAGITPRHNQFFISDFHSMRDGAPYACRFKGFIAIAQHKETPEMMILAYNYVLNEHKICNRLGPL